eukprot:g36403.t1
MDKLKRPKVDKSLEPDGLHPRDLKKMAEKIVEVLVVIFQESLESGRVPVDCKIAHVKCIFKKGGRQNIENYRLVSLTLVVDKILDLLLRIRLRVLEVH